MNPPLIYPLDSAKYREQYLSNLRLQASNDQKNLNANVIFKQTGRTPTQLTDMRTTTEKFADIEGLRVEVRSALQSSGILNGVGANEVSVQLSPAELQYFVQFKDFLIKEFKGRNVPSPVFIAYLQRQYEKQQKTKGVDFGLQQSTGRDILHGIESIRRNMVSYKDFQDLQNVIGKIETIPELHNEGVRIHTYLTEVLRQFPTEEELRVITEVPPEIRADIDTLLNAALEDMPSSVEVRNLVGQLRAATEGQNPDIRQAKESLAELSNILYQSSTLMGQLKVIKETAEQHKGEYVRPAVPTKPERMPLTPIKEGGTEGGFTEGETAVPPYGGAAAEEGQSVSTYEELTQEQKQQIREVSIPATKQEFINEITGNPHRGGNILNKIVRQEGITLSAEQIIKKKDGTEVKKTISLSPNKLIGATNPTKGVMIKLFEDYLRQRDAGATETKEGHGLRPRMKGKGLSRPIQRKTPAERSEGFVKENPYKQFGRYLIHRRKLNDNILMLKRPQGGGVNELPTQHTSANLTKVIKKLSKGEQPSFDELNDLSTADKELLHKLVKVSHYENVSVPEPNKMSLDKDLNRFDILRGEIIAGNDSKELVKEFKTLVLKFANSDRIPRRQANEILMELTALGH